jgi:hypothetical protein
MTGCRGFDAPSGQLENLPRYARPDGCWVYSERTRVQTREWLLTAAVIVIPLIIAIAVTMWSLDQVRYRPKKGRSAPLSTREAAMPVERGDEPSESSL